MAIKKLILHLGMSKAGSTSIQHTLFNNATILEKNGFRYLTEWGQNHLHVLKHIFSSFPVSPLDRKLIGRPLTEKERERDKRKLINTMLEVINSTDCENLILSGEFWGQLHFDSTIENISNFLDKYFRRKGIEAHIIFLVRNPLTHTISSFQQKLFAGTYNEHFLEGNIRAFEGIINLQKHFTDSLTLLKFEDAALDKDGLVGCFLKAIGYPKDKIQELDILRANDSRCLEVMELAGYIESREPATPYGINNTVNPKREPLGADLTPLKNIKGTKFDFPYRDKLALWSYLKGTVNSLKENIGIDYTGYQIAPLSSEEETYNEATIQEFIEAYPKLNPIIQGLFLDFFEAKYNETLNEKFKKLYSSSVVS